MACKKGVVLLVLWVSFIQAEQISDESCEPIEEQEELSETTPSYTFSSRGILDLEKLLEENPDLIDLFDELSPEEREGLIETIEEFNKAFRQALETAVSEVNPDSIHESQ